MKGNNFQNIIMLVLVNIIIKPIWIFGVDRNVQETVGHASFGLYYSLFNLSLMFQVVLDMGLQTYNSQKIAQNNNRISYLLPNILVAKTGLALIYFLILTIWTWFFYSGFEFTLLLLLGLMQVFNSLLLYFRSCVTALHRYRSDVLLSVLDKGLMILFGLALLYLPYFEGFQIQWYVYAQIAAFGIASIIALFVILKNTHFSKFKIHLPYVLPIIRKGIPIAILVLLMSIFMRGDLVLLERLKVNIDAEEAGRYVSSFRLLDAANNFTGILLASWLLPMFAGHLKNKAYIKLLCFGAMRILMPISFGLLVFTFFYGESLMQYLYTRNYIPGDGYLLYCLMLSFPFYCFTYVYSTLNTAHNKIARMSAFAFIAAVFSVIANWVLVPVYGAVAVAINSVIAQGVFALCNYFYAKKSFDISYNWSFVKKMAVFITLDIAFLYGLYQFELGVVPNLLLNVVFLGILMPLLKIIQLHDLKQLKSE